MELRARAIQAIIESAAQKPDSGFFATAVGMILLLLGAGGVVGQLHDSLNTIWRVTPKAGRGIRGFLQNYLVSYSMVLSVGFLLLVSLVISAVLTAVTSIIGGFLPIDPATAHTLDLVVSFAFITFLFAVIYKFVPDVRIAWGDVWTDLPSHHCCFPSENISSAFIWVTARSRPSTVRPVHLSLFCCGSTTHPSCFSSAPN